MSVVPLGSLIRRGIVVAPHEAVAIAQQLIHSRVDVELTAPLGPPTVETIVMLPDGRVASRSCAATPTVSDVGRLLDAMLPSSGSGQVVAGGLRYTVARALLEVDAPPFDSVRAFYASLARFQMGEPRQVVRSLLARADGLGPRLRSGPGPRLVPKAGSHREHVPPVDSIVGREPSRLRPSRRRVAIRAAAAVLLSFALGWLAGMEMLRERDPKQAAVASTTVDLPVTLVPVAPAAEGTTRPVEMYSPAFSPDGRTVFFHTGGSRAARSALMRRSGDDGTARPVAVLDDGARNYHAQPSPDGRRVAFDSDRDGARAVYLADADGTNIRRISGSGYAAVPTWSPTGDRLAFVRAEPDRPKVWNLWLLTFSTGELRRLTRFAYGQTWGASWLPDGERVVFSHEDRLVVLSLSDRRLWSYPTPVNGRLVRTPAVSPDGHRVIFQVSHDGAWILNLDSGAMRRVLDDPTAEEFAWSPDGRRVAYHGRVNGRWAIHIIAPPEERL